MEVVDASKGLPILKKFEYLIGKSREEITKILEKEYNYGCTLNLKESDYIIQKNPQGELIITFKKNRTKSYRLNIPKNLSDDIFILLQVQEKIDDLGNLIPGENQYKGKFYSSFLVKKFSRDITKVLDPESYYRELSGLKDFIFGEDCGSTTKKLTGRDNYQYEDIKDKLLKIPFFENTFKKEISNFGCPAKIELYGISEYLDDEDIPYERLEVLHSFIVLDILPNGESICFEKAGSLFGYRLVKLSSVLKMYSKLKYYYIQSIER